MSSCPVVCSHPDPPVACLLPSRLPLPPQPGQHMLPLRPPFPRWHFSCWCPTRGPARPPHLALRTKSPTGKIPEVCVYFEAKDSAERSTFFPKRCCLKLKEEAPGHWLHKWTSSQAAPQRRPQRRPVAQALLGRGATRQAASVVSAPGTPGPARQGTLSGCGLPGAGPVGRCPF